MIEIFKNTNYNFLGFRKKGFVISSILILTTIGVHHLPWRLQPVG